MLSPIQSAINEALKVFESRPISREDQRVVDEIKVRAALLLALIEDAGLETSPESFRLGAMARTHLEQAVMCAVKALSRKSNNG